MISRLAYRPLVEALESRLQPGSLLTTNAYAWSLAEKLPVSNQEAWDSVSTDSRSIPESGKPTYTSPPVVAHSDHLEIAVTAVAAARSQRPDTPASGVINYLALDLTNDDLAKVSLTGGRHTVPLAVVATPALSQLAPATPLGSVLQSPIGVATPATNSSAVQGSSGVSLHPTGKSTSGYRAVPVETVSTDSATILPLTGYHTTHDIQAVPFVLANQSNRFAGVANQATLNFLSYLGASGPDSINSVAVQQENGSNFIYVAGSVTDLGGQTHVFAAKLTNGAASVVWSVVLATPAAGPDRASGLAVNGNNVYVAGTFANPSVDTHTDAFVIQLDAHTGDLLSSGTLSNASFAAVATDPAGNVYLAGTIPDPTIANLHDVEMLKATSDLSTTIYGKIVQFTAFNPALGRFVPIGGAVTTGSALVIDGQGNIYIAGSRTIPDDPTNDSMPFYAWLNDQTGQLVPYASFYATNLTAGPRGMGTAIALDPSGNLVFTGTLNFDGGTPLDQNLLIGRAKPTRTPTSTGGVVSSLPRLDAYQYYVDDRVPYNEDFSAGHSRVGDWTGNGLVVLADGSSIVAGAAYDPAAPNNPPLSKPSNGIDVHLTHFLPSDSGTASATIDDADPENIFGGSGTDIGLAVALDPTNPMNVYVVGNTTSTDLPTTPGVWQSTFGGGNSTGFVGQASVA